MLERHVLNDVGMANGMVQVAGWLVFPLIGVGAATMRGTIGDGREAVQRGTRITESLRCRATDGLEIGGVVVPELDECKHFKFIGTTGTGKSTAIGGLLARALARGDRAIVADPDGGYCRRFHDAARGDLVLNPFDPRSVRWDLYRELRQPHDYEALVASIVPDVGASNDSWNRYARVFLSALLEQTHGVDTSGVGLLLRLVRSAPLEELRILLEGTAAQPFLETGNERMFASLRSVAVSAVAPLQHVEAQGPGVFSVRDWVRAGRGTLFLCYRAGEVAALRSLIATWMRIAIVEALSGVEADHRLWFVVDELDALGRIHGLKDALARLRKFGGRCVLGFQSIAQVSGTYGDAEAQTIVENCANTLVLRCSASERGGTAQFASRLIGEREVIRHTVSSSRPAGFVATSRRTKTLSTQRTVEAAVMPAEIEQLPDLNGYLKLASRPDWQRVRLHRAAS
jgi:type IV secretory pathway TraG/TraD family ATPase VirD4